MEKTKRTPIPFVGLLFWIAMMVSCAFEDVVVSRDVKLGPLQGQTFERSFEYMDAINLEVLIAYPTAISANKRLINGYMQILNKDTVIVSYAFSPATLRPCNWLSEHGLEGAIIKPVLQKKINLTNVLTNGGSYVLRIEFEEELEPRVYSIWLNWKQTVRTIRDIEHQ